MNNQDIRQWLEEQLPDYCFNRLTEEDALRFSEEVKQFPDLLEEVQNVKKLFSGLEELDMRSGYDSKLKNLSYKVVENYSYTQNTYFKRPSFAALASAFVIGIILFGYYSLPLNETNVVSTHANNTNNIETITNSENTNFLQEYDSQTLHSLDEFEDEIVESTIQTLEPKTAFAVTNANPMSLPVHSLKTLDEPEIVDLITTLENEDFSF